MKYLFLSLSLLLFRPVVAQDSLLTAFYQDNSYSLALADGSFSGPGREVLLKAGRDNAFFLVGEAHGMAELPQFTAALFKAFQPFGYKYFATETGPNAAAFLERTRKQANWKDALRQHFTDLPWSIPFYAWEEEWEILDAIGKDGSAQEPRLWGIDQEFAVSFRMFFKQLAEEAPNTVARELAQAYYERCAAGLAKAKETGNPGATFMMSASEADFTKLRAAFVGEAAALHLLDQLEESIAIYQLWTKNKAYASNDRRAKLMKTQFAHYYHQAQQQEKSPRVMFKLGANHVNRGASPLNIFDIGNFVSELADQQQQSSFHLLVITQAGTQNAFTPFSRSDDDKSKAFSHTESFNRSDCKALFAAVDTKEWTLVDTRPLRVAVFNKQLKNVDASILRLIFGFDALLVIPQATASTLSE